MRTNAGRSRHHGDTKARSRRHRCSHWTAPRQPTSSRGAGQTVPLHSLRLEESLQLEEGDRPEDSDRKCDLRVAPSVHKLRASVVIQFSGLQLPLHRHFVEVVRAPCPGFRAASRWSARVASPCRWLSRSRPRWVWNRILVVDLDVDHARVEPDGDDDPQIVGLVLGDVARPHGVEHAVGDRRLHGPHQDVRVAARC